MYFAGLDIGSTITKIVVLNGDVIRVTRIRPTGAEHRRQAHQMMVEALSEAGLRFEQMDYIVATGYGRINVPFADRQVTEITCHMRGVNLLFPDVRTIIDIGGQDSKGIKVANGRVANFVMNDKCAAGTGRFLEVMAEALGVKLEEIGSLSLQSRRPSEISSICTVFAEQEAILRLSQGDTVADILAGIHRANASRIFSMVQKIKIEKEVAITGGGAKNIGLRKALEEKLGFEARVPPEPLITGALGAAFLAAEYGTKTSSEERLANRQKRRLAEVTFFDDKATSKPAE